MLSEAKSTTCINKYQLHFFWIHLQPKMLIIPHDVFSIIHSCQSVPDMTDDMLYFADDICTVFWCILEIPVLYWNVFCKPNKMYLKYDLPGLLQVVVMLVREPSDYNQPPYNCVSHWQQRYSVESLSIHHSTVMFLSILLAWKNTISPSKMNTLSKYKLKQ